MEVGSYVKNLSLKSFTINLNYLISVNTTPMSFSITGQGTETSQVGVTCSTDWITIPCATNSNDPVAQTGTPAVCVDRICGMVFNSVQGASAPSVPVTSNSILEFFPNISYFLDLQNFSILPKYLLIRWNLTWM